MAGVITPAQYIGGGGGGAVSSVFGRSGAVIAAIGDYTVAQVTGAAPLASPALTGVPTAPTAGALTNSTQIGTTAYTDTAVAVETSRAEAAEALLAPKASPTFTGTVTIPNGASAQAAAAYGQTPAGGATTTIAQGGTGQTTAAAALTALGALAQQTGAASGLGLSLLATTGQAGYTMFNGTGVILTYTFPNDGLIHRFMTLGQLIVTTLEVGGAVGLAFTSPDGTTATPSLVAAAQGVGLTTMTFRIYAAKAGTAVSVSQTSALTAGAGVLYAEIWGS